MTIVVEDGSGISNSNSYASVAEADAYLAVKVGQNTAWMALSTPNKESYLEWSTLLIEQRTRWRGHKAIYTSALSWPRAGVDDKEGIPIPADVVPKQVKDATIEIANYLVVKGNDPSVPSWANSQNAIKSLRADVLEVTYDTGLTASISSFPNGLSYLLIPLGYFSGAGRVGFAKVARS